MSNKTLVRVSDVMKSAFDMVDGTCTVAQALKTMKHADTKCLMINRRNEADEYGVVMLSDIASEVLAKNRAPERVNVYEIMSKPVVSVDPQMDIRYCARLFKNFGLSRVPVIENRQVIGIVSYTDLVLKGLCKDIV